MTLAAPEIAARRRRGQDLLRTLDADARALHVLASFNLDLLPPFLAEALDRRAIATRPVTAPFGQIAQPILDPASDLAGDLLVVPAVEDQLAGLFDGSTAAGAASELADARLDELEGAIGAALERLPGSTIFVAAYGTHRVPDPHVLDPGDARRGQAAITRFLDGVREFGQLSPRVVVVDWDWHLRGVGGSALVDDRMWHLGRMRLNPAGLAEFADLVGRHAGAYRGAARKVLAVDLDGTVWGGVVGEVGVGGLTLGDEAAGLAFREFQQELVRLHDSGVVLVAASKNNREDVVEAFEGHPSMVLKVSHFAAERIDWQDKATNLRAMADELSLGLDSFVFLDDNPVEREWVSQALPEVLVPELPEDPSARPAFLRALEVFDRIALTDADTQRAASYRAQGGRSRLKATTGSFEDFIRSLEQEVTVEAVDATSLPRAAQLCQRTNQFNLTTRRHSAADLERMLGDDAFELYTVAVRDRFGDSGVTGLAILHQTATAEAEVDTFLLSCRVLGRQVEDALLAFVASRAAARGVTRLVGRYVETAKNAQARGFYEDRGFTPVDGDPGAAVRDLSAQPLEMPSAMTTRLPAHA